VERLSFKFYLQEASRLALLAIDATDPGIRLQMLEMPPHSKGSLSVRWRAM
jgi:hypothetical protein